MEFYFSFICVLDLTQILMYIKVIINVHCLQLLLSVSDTFNILLTLIKMYEFLLLVPGVFWSNLCIKNRK